MTGFDTFPQAPDGWSIDTMQAIAAEENITITDDHKQLVHCLQEYYSKKDFPRLREITDALEECFHSRGGMKYLYQILPGGPVAQGCRLAGLPVPAGSVDKSFGSVA
jgi:tRNA 2-thiouridine synthesizing protein E